MSRGQRVLLRLVAVFALGVGLLQPMNLNPTGQRGAEAFNPAKPILLAGGVVACMPCLAAITQA